MKCFSLKGKTVLITGASGGIGLALVKGFVEASANVIATDLNLEPIKASIKNDCVIPFKLDVSNADEIKNVLQQARAYFDPVTVLINNAGIKSNERLIDGDVNKIQKTLTINTDSVLSLTRIVYKDSLRNFGGAIINIGSSISSKGAVFNYQAGGADYC